MNNKSDVKNESKVNSNLLEIKDLVVSFKNHGGKSDVVHGFNLKLKRGETVGIVGESGSGKTMSMLAMARLLPSQAFVSAGTIQLEDEHLLSLESDTFHSKISGKRIAMIFQEPMTALNPVYTIGHQMIETVMLHENVSKTIAQSRAIEMLEAVQLPQPKERLGQYPHQLSGGQRQRVMIAMALLSKPDLMIADEPTTALDVTVQNDIIQLLIDLQKRFGMAMIFISHDLGVVSRVSKNIIVMKQGEIVETGKTSSVLTKPKHPYTKGLLECLWKLDDKNRGALDPTAPPVIKVKNISKTYSLRSGLFKSARQINAVTDANFEVKSGETLAIVGESGSGKSTLAKIINGLETPDNGSVYFGEKRVQDLSLKDRARLVQPIFQDPYSTLNPKQTIGYIISRPLIVHGLAGDDLKSKVLETMEQAGLSAEFYHRFPNQLSGGQRQRVAIARAIILRPSILICDEPTSALDVSIQEQILDLLNDLQRKYGMTLILISHDMAVVGYLADRVLVMLNGKIVEFGNAKNVLETPSTAYTQKLMNSVYRVPKNTPVTRGVNK